MAFIEIKKLYKSYKTSTDEKKDYELEVLINFNLSIEERQFITFFGPNGCGKTTLLNCISSLIDINSGTIEINDKPAIQSEIGYVFQNFQATFLPWKKNIDNVAFPLELKRINKNERRKIAKDFLKRLDINIPENNYPYQLSGGQLQLLAIARALISNPQVLLLDEPFNQLDYQTRISMNNKILEIWQKTKTTILFVSHEIDEAIILGDKTIFLSKRPAEILEIMENELPRPRKYDVIKTEKFFALKKRGIEIFKQALNK